MLAARPTHDDFRPGSGCGGAGDRIFLAKDVRLLEVPLSLRRPPTTLVLMLATATVAAEPSPLRPCEADPASRRLDFWVGSWTVYGPGGERDGRNLIEKILAGCALVENWTDAAGWEGKSLFYRVDATGEWKQVWVTDSGPMKEKSLVREFTGPGVRFQGVVSRNGKSILDRTTLTPLPDGRVRQLIEQSADGGATWHTAYDGLYVRDPAGK
jgi:hypothetical protein